MLRLPAAVARPQETGMDDVHSGPTLGALQSSSESGGRILPVALPGLCEADRTLADAEPSPEAQGKLLWEDLEIRAPSFFLTKAIHYAIMYLG